MFLRARVTWLRRWGFPRASGDVPHLTAHDMTATEFSPRERGCSYGSQAVPRSPAVFPARAGMFLDTAVNPIYSDGFPRASGDVPMRIRQPDWCREFSPRERGCSLGTNSKCRVEFVFPARAGMFQAAGSATSAQSSFSPRERGCSWNCHRIQSDRPVFPARAGMFLSRHYADNLLFRFPRASGDVPNLTRKQQRHLGFSPRERGCS